MYVGCGLDRCDDCGGGWFPDGCSCKEDYVRGWVVVVKEVDGGFRGDIEDLGGAYGSNEWVVVDGSFAVDDCGV
jgi:hypothetical protein